MNLLVVPPSCRVGRRSHESHRNYPGSDGMFSRNLSLSKEVPVDSAVWGS